MVQDRKFIEACEKALSDIDAIECDIQNFHLYLPEDGITKRVTVLLKYALESLARARKRINNAIRINSLRHQLVIVYDPSKNEAHYANGTEAEKLIVAIEEKRTQINVG